MTQWSAFPTAEGDKGAYHLCACATSQQISGRIISLILMPSGSAHPHLCHESQLHCAAWAKGRICSPKCCCLFLSGNKSHGQTAIPDPWDCISSDSDMADSGSSCWNRIMALGGRASHSQRATPLYPRLSSSITLHIAQAAPLPFLSCLSPHIRTLWWLLLHAGHVAGGPLGAAMCGGKRVSTACLCPPLEGRSMGSMPVSMSLSSSFYTALPWI